VNTEKILDYKINPIKYILHTKAILAPISGVSDIPYRLIARKFGCKFAFTEMVDINGIFYKNLKSFNLLDRIDEDKPLGVQLVGQDIDKFLYVAKICEDKGFKVLDINAACPARKVVKCGKGSALLKEPKKFAKLIRTLVKNLSIPVTIKIRSAWNEKYLNYMEIVDIACSEGVKLICIHPRTKEQMYKGIPDYEIIKNIKQKISIPVFASGNVFSIEDINNIFNNTGCDGVYIARGGFGNPWFFKEINDFFLGKRKRYIPDFFEIKNIIKEHFDISLRFYSNNQTKSRMYKHISWYLKRFKNLHDIMQGYLKIDNNFNAFSRFIDKIELENDKYLYIKE